MEKISLASEPIFHIGIFPITNSILATWLVMLILIIIGLVISKTIKKIPGTIQNIFEYAIESLLNLMDSVTQDRSKTEKFFPFVVTFFFFILLSNWIELIPGFSAIGIKTVEEGHLAIIPFLRSANTDLNTTLALAIISVVAIQIFGIASLGFFKYAKKFLNFSSVIGFFLGLLEIVSEIARIISFSFRLFGNIFAGEVLLVVISYLIPYILPIPFYGMELFVGFIQALVFAMLTVVFMTVATTSHEEAH